MIIACFQCELRSNGLFQRSEISRYIIIPSRFHTQRFGRIASDNEGFKDQTHYDSIAYISQGLFKSLDIDLSDHEIQNVSQKVTCTINP